MARQIPMQQNGGDIMPSRYTEQRTPQFVGGAVDPTSGNIRSSSADEAARGQVQQSVGQGLTDLLEPKTPTTRLGQAESVAPVDRPPPAPPAVGAAAQAAETANFVASTPTRAVNTAKSLWNSISSWF